MKYRKKPVVIEAIQWTGNEEPNYLLDIAQFFRDFDDWGFTSGDETMMIKIKTLEGWMTAVAGDYIIKGIKGEYYPCKPDIFEQTYELCEED